MLTLLASAALLALCAALPACEASPGCVSAANCSYNGRCARGTRPTAAAQCVCDPGWCGTSCQSLRLLPAALPAAQAYCHYNDSTWGGSVIFHGGLYHLYFSEMSNNCSLHMYAAVSRVVHATSPTPAGPYERRGVALPVLAHNPQIIRNPADGSFLLFHIGATVNARCVPDATAAGATRLQPAPTLIYQYPVGHTALLT